MLDRLIFLATKLVPYPGDDSSGGMEYWRIRFLYILIVIMLFLGIVAYIPSLYLSLASGVWVIAIIDTVALIFVLVLGFSRKLSARIKINIMLGMTYFLGISLMVILGPMGAGFVWLFLFPVLAAILLSFRAVVFCILLLLVSFAIMAFPIVLQIPGNYHLIVYSPMTWLVNVANFLAVNFLVSTSISLIISRLSNTLENEIQISELLKTEQEKLKEEKRKAEEADQLKSKFLANMSHEVRTPMNGILGFMDLLSNPELDEKRKDKYIQYIRQSGNRMLEILNDLVNISKIEANQIEISTEEINVPEVLEYTTSLFSSLASEKGINLSCINALANASPILTTDKNKLIQVVSNLIQNALKFTQTGDVVIRYQKGNGELTFSVSDTGIGIKPEQIAHVFDRFNHTESEVDKVQQGAGLGLAIAKAFVELMGGRIWLESELHKGSIFYFTIPA